MPKLINRPRWTDLLVSIHHVESEKSTIQIFDFVLALRGPSLFFTKLLSKHAEIQGGYSFKARCDLRVVLHEILAITPVQGPGGTGGVHDSSLLLIGITLMSRQQVRPMLSPTDKSELKVSSSPSSKLPGQNKTANSPSILLLSNSMLNRLASRGKSVSTVATAWPRMTPRRREAVRCRSLSIPPPSSRPWAFVPAAVAKSWGGAPCHAHRSVVLPPQRPPACGQVEDRREAVALPWMEETANEAADICRHRIPKDWQPCRVLVERGCGG